ncbi:MAG: NAD(+)/NADH kinase [Candidatus Syntropharchaeales archaeon]|nr:NAD(+)/NADH kinase [Candidatus Syntrophoarchaeum sp.]
MIRAERVGIVARDDLSSMAERIVKCIEGCVEVVADPTTAYKLEMRGVAISDMDVDMVICVGGDGTILRTLRSMDEPIPLLGIGMGALGFLAALTPEEALKRICEVLDGFEVEKRSRLDIIVDRERVATAMNEIVFLTLRPAKMLHFKIFIDGEEFERLRADGVVFSTPTGSTAYSMSAGGPIVDPEMNCTIIVPLAPFKLSARPAVVAGSRKVKFGLIEPDKDAMLVIDGETNRSIKQGDEVEIVKSDRSALFVKAGDGFFSRIRNKLMTI